MPYIELVIKISEDEYRMCKSCLGDADCIESAIANGTPLPKGHGELIDRNKIEYLKAIHDAKYGHISWSEASKRIKYSAPTIIEADKR